MIRSPLHKKLVRQIENTGPMTLAEYMGLALMHPEHGYYATRDPFGTQGDFITAPEVSQMFGELIGLWAAQCWLDMGSPSPIQVIELGPGRGTLQSDFQRAIKSALPDFWTAMQLHLVETSETLAGVQAKTLSDLCARQPTWHQSLQQCPQGPFLLIANEFFDALPISQYIKADDGWHERLIGLEAEPGSNQLQFVAAVLPEPSDRLLPAPVRQSPSGTIAETCPVGQAITSEIAQRATHDPGIALIIDYGHTESAAGDTLQALKAHQYVGVFETPGEADLTAHVDFATLKSVAETAGASTTPVMTQSEFLTRLGIEARTQALTATASDKQRQDIESALNRLIAPDQMGTLFKVMALYSKDLPELPGFALS